MESNDVQKDFPSFHEDAEELPIIEEQISTGFPSFHEPAKPVYPSFTEPVNVIEELPQEETPITGTIPSFYSAFAIEEEPSN